MPNSFWKPLFSSLFLALPSAAFAWNVETDSSQINFVTTKKHHVAEANIIPQLSGSLSDDGTLDISIEMNSVDSGIAVRNQRLLDILFKVVDFPTANFQAQIDMDAYSSLAVGESMDSEIDGELTIMGIQDFAVLEVTVTRLAEGRVMVTSKRPTVVDGSFYELEDGIEELRSVAELNHISYSVPVTMTVVFSK